MTRPSSDLDGQNTIPVARLAEYIRAVSAMRGVNELSVDELIVAMENVTRRQLIRDLSDLGFDVAYDLPRDQLAMALRVHLKKAKSAYRVTSAELVPLLSAPELLGRVDSTHAQRAGTIEAAYEYAIQEPELFLLGHGLFESRTDLEVSHPVIAYPHQIQEARRIVEQYLGNSIAVHEVGLGKTITAILVLCELWVRDPSLTTLILVPANLKAQWEKELTRCVTLPVYCGNSQEELASSSYILMSIDTAKEKRWARLLASRTWGLLIVDEGHLLRHEITARYRFIYSLHTHHRLLLTATPVHNSPYDIYNQVNIVRPGILGTKESFAATYMIGERQLAKPEELQEQLQQVVSHKQRDGTFLSFPQRVIEDVFIEDPSMLERHLYNDVLGILRGIYRHHRGTYMTIRRPSGFEQGISQIVLIAILVLRELASHPAAALKTLAGPLLREVKRLAALSGDTSDLSLLEKFLDQYSKEHWQQGSHKKTDALLNRLPELVNKYGRVIVYVEFRETQRILVERLQCKREIGLPPKTVIIPYHGNLTMSEKSHQIELFENHTHACFLSTDAGGQGLNLQQGNVVANLDFPWNPMRIEQRIGRVDRLGQLAEQVIVHNYITVDTIEQYVYQTLRQKLRVCEDVLGHVLPVIFKLRMRGVQYYSEADVLGIGHIILSSKDDEDLRQKFLAFGRVLDGTMQSKSAVWQPSRSWIDE